MGRYYRRRCSSDSQLSKRLRTISGTEGSFLRWCDISVAWGERIWVDATISVARGERICVFPVTWQRRNSHSVLGRTAVVFVGLLHACNILEKVSGADCNSDLIT